jgi:hypothetical protein
MVPSKSEIHGSPARIKIWAIAIKAISVPAIGVHSPGMRRTPDPTRKADVIAALTGGPLHSVELERTTSTEPPTRRMRSKPRPGQPPANVEYRRRNETSFQLIASDTAGRIAAPKRVRLVTL